MNNKKMKIEFGGYISMPFDFDEWPKEEQEKYIKIGTEDGWLDLNPPVSWKIKVKLHKLIDRLKNIYRK